MPEIFPVLLCGGSGTRLWPVSRKSFPKQFVPLAGPGTLFQAAAGRMQGAPDVGRPLVLTNSDFRFIVAEQLAADGIRPGAILIEPEARNTGPAILAAALHLAAERGHTAFLEVLLKRGGASVNPKTTNGSVAMHFACYNNHVDAVRT